MQQTTFLQSTATAIKYVSSPWWFLQLLKSLFLPKRWVIFLALLFGYGKLRGNDTIRLTDNSKVVLYLPAFLKDLTARIAWPINVLINLAPLLCQIYMKQSKTVWPTQIALTPCEDASKAKTSILSEKISTVSQETLMQLFDSLEAAHSDEVIGKTWSGKIIRTGTSVLDLVDVALARPLHLIGLGWGKRFCSRQAGDPLVFDWMTKVLFPLPLWGNASIVDMEYRGKVQATTRFSHQPWEEHLRVLDQGTESGRKVLLGAWCTRDTIGGWFTLTHQVDVETAIQ